nr:hypothetical protein [Chromatocurvus halotolerans]
MPVALAMSLRVIFGLVRENAEMTSRPLASELMKSRSLMRVGTDSSSIPGSI